MVAIDRNGITVRHYQLFNSRRSYHRIGHIRKVELVRKGVSRFSEQTQQFVLRVVMDDSRNSELDLTESISSVVIKRRYIELETFLGR